MVYFTGDIHGKATKILDFIHRHNLSEQDIIVVLGDAGINYHGNEQGDRTIKRKLNSCGVTVFCIHGNHEARPGSISSYRESRLLGGRVYIEEEYPGIVFAKDGEIFDFDGHPSLVIGGAYSVDKFYRLTLGYKWFADEQPDEEIKRRVESVLDGVGWSIDTVLTHTCPYKYIPVEAFLPGLDQSTVDNSTEHWLDDIENRLTYNHWLCGHWHIDKHIDRIRFLMDSFEVL